MWYVRRAGKAGAERGTEPKKAGADGADEDREVERVFPIFRKRTATSRASEKGGGKKRARGTDKKAGGEPAALGEERDWNDAGAESPRHDPG